MKLDVSFTPDLVALIKAEVAAGQKAVSMTMAQAGASLKLAWRVQITGAGLGARLANTIQSQTYPKGRNSLDAAALVWSNAPVNRLSRLEIKADQTTGPPLKITVIAIQAADDPAQAVEIFQRDGSGKWKAVGHGG